MSQPTESPTETAKVVSKRIIRFELAPLTMIILVLVIAGLWLLFKLLPVLLVLIAAFFIVGTLNPAVRWLEKKGIRRGLSIGIVFGSITVSALVVAILTIPALLIQASSIWDQEPGLRAQLADRLSRFPLSDALVKWLRNLKYGGPVSAAGTTAFAYSMDALKFLTLFMSAISLALYIMLDRDRLRGGLFAIIPRSHHVRLSRVVMKLETIVGAYIRGQAITSLSIGSFILVLLVACGVENAMALAVFGAFADILPYIGVFLPMAAGVLSAAPHGPVITLVVLGSMVVYTQFESRILVPKAYGQALRLPSTVVLISLLAGGTLMGVTGALLSLPFAAAVIMLIEELRVQLPGQQEQAADGAQRAKDDKGEEEFERRSEGATAERSAAIAVEISGDRAAEESRSIHTTKRGENGSDEQ
jgi:predicted PurR-regulated permease PerM